MFMQNSLLSCTSCKAYLVSNFPLLFMAQSICIVNLRYTCFSFNPQQKRKACVWWMAMPLCFIIELMSIFINSLNMSYAQAIVLDFFSFTFFLLFLVYLLNLMQLRSYSSLCHFHLWNSLLLLLVSGLAIHHLSNLVSDFLQRMFFLCLEVFVSMKNNWLQISSAASLDFSYLLQWFCHLRAPSCKYPCLFSQYILEHTKLSGLKTIYLP